MFYKISFVFFLVLCLWLVLPVLFAGGISEAKKEPEIKIIFVEIPEPPDPTLLTHAQEIWISALEWCESRGNPAAINWNDTDGRPAYYSYQFKRPSFRSFGEAYGLLETGLSDSDLMVLMEDTALQRSIVRRMMTDVSVNMRTQFPGCIKLLGMPPEY